MKRSSDEETVSMNRHSLPVLLFQKRLEAWGTTHRRIFPWRLTDNPYAILIAELMLRRTQARQVCVVYEQFLSLFPDIRILAVAEPEQVAQTLFPLGLSWRVPAFQAIAQRVLREYEGHVPTSYQTLLTLPGVGDYVASAVCCFAFGQPLPLIDTNTVRVVGRVFEVPTHAESRRQSPIRHVLSSLVDVQAPLDYNYSLLDLAATLCLPAHPQCELCPLLQMCATGQKRTSSATSTYSDQEVCDG